MIAYGAFLGAGVGLGLSLVITRLLQLRHTSVSARVLPFLRDLSGPVVRPPGVGETRALQGVFGPLVGSTAGFVGRLLGGEESIRRRLRRANLDMEVTDFRVEQVVWGVVAFVGAAIPAAFIASASPSRTVPLLILCLVVMVLGVMLRENRLTAQVNARESQILLEFPTVAEMLALSVAAGESPVSALDRVVSRSRGELSAELQRVLDRIQTGTPVSAAFDEMAARTGLSVVARFAEAIAIATERGTPLAEVLHAQAADVREAGRRVLIETGARKEIAMMLPVVFLVMPIVIVFAFYPGMVGLNLVVN
jgi:tight adherence protein C